MSSVLVFRGEGAFRDRIFWEVSCVRGFGNITPFLVEHGSRHGDASIYTLYYLTQRHLDGLLIYFHSTY